MVNGWTSRILYVGVFTLLAIILSGVILLSLNDKPVSGELYTVMFSLVGFLVGTHVKAPVADTGTISNDPVHQIVSKIADGGSA